MAQAMEISSFDGCSRQHVCFSRVGYWDYFTCRRAFRQRPDKGCAYSRSDPTRKLCAGAPRAADARRSTRMGAGAYLRQLCLAISRSKLDAKGIKLAFLECAFQMNSRCGRRLGLIVSELITNAARPRVHLRNERRTHPNRLIHRM